MRREIHTDSPKRGLKNFRSTHVLANNRPGVTYIVILSLRNSVGAVQMNHNFSFSALTGNQRKPG